MGHEKTVDFEKFYRLFNEAFPSGTLSILWR